MIIYIFRILCCIFITCEWYLSSEEAYTLIENQAKISILTPSLSDQQILKLKLANGLKVYLISDPGAIKSAASLTVQVGSWEDPLHYPGLAHFLEHMLFLGTAKYPIESDYDRFIKEHNGRSNAYTACDHTLYLFSINNDAFEEALDRFSYFFKEPLFNPSGVSRELQAIDQEFAKDLDNDGVREYYVQKELSNPKHPFHRFNCGNSSTLSQVSQETLKTWYQEHYSANLMHLIVYSPLPLETLKKLVIENFKDIPNINRTPYSLSTSLFSETQQSHIAYIYPIRDIHSVRLTWELPSIFANQEEMQSETLLSCILENEGPGSLIYELKKENLAEELCCAGYRLGPNHSLFSIYIDLTKEGLQSINSVLNKCFAAVTNLKQQNIPPYIFDELQKMDMIRYQYQSRQDPFEQLMEWGEWIIYENLSTFPEHSAIIKKFDSQLIKYLLSQLTPERAFITLIAKPDILNIKSDRKEQWMKVPYTIRPLSSEQVKRWSHIPLDPTLHLPIPNPFIPQHLYLRQSHLLINKRQVPYSEQVKRWSHIPLDPTLHLPTPNPFIPQHLYPRQSHSLINKRQIPYPDIILDNEEAKIYYAEDQIFEIPQTVWSFDIKTPAIKRNEPLKVVLGDLYIKSLEDSLNLYSYNAKIAGLEYEIQRGEYGINLTIQGYSDNAEILFDAILQHLTTCYPSEQFFYLFKDSLLRDYQNFAEESALQQGLETFQSILHEDFSNHQQKALALQEVTYPQFLDYLSHLFDHTYTYGLFYGNIEKSHALNLWKKLHQTLSSLPYSLHEQDILKIANLPPHKGPFFIETRVKSPSHATILGIEDVSFSFTSRAAQQILMQAISESFYSTLRTKQQTGYLIFTKGEELEKRLFNLFAVQSNTHDPRDLLARFELFIETFLQEMRQTELTEERFEVIRHALLTTTAQPPQNLIDMGTLLKTLAFRYKDFDWISKRIQGFKELTYENFLTIASQFLGKDNKRRLAILVEGALPEKKGLQYIRANDTNEIRDLSVYTHD